MPDTPDFDAARRSLGDVPAPDLWPEAERRAAAGGVVPLDPDVGRTRRPTRWLAAAAVAVLAVGTIAVLADGDDDQVDTTAEATTSPITIIGADGCRFGITPPTDFLPGPPDPPLFEGRQSAEQTVVHKAVGTQVLEIRVPGLALIDLVGERVEPVELRRGTADLWFGHEFVQVRWLTESQDPCDSFTVTVAGSTEDGNRHAAVDWAERILLPKELAAADDSPLAAVLPGTTWRVVELYRDGEPVPFDRVQFPDRLELTFSGDEIGWGDGCNLFGGSVTIDDAGYLEVGESAMTLVECATPEDRAVQEAIGMVIHSDRVSVRLMGDRLELSDDGEARIVLERA